MRRQKKICSFAAVLLASAVFTAASAGVCFAGSWKQEQGKWWYDLGGGQRATGWNWIDSDGDGNAESYYFDAAGQLVTNTTTPDGYEVNEKGAWVENGKVRTSDAVVSDQFVKAPPIPVPGKNGQTTPETGTKKKETSEAVKAPETSEAEETAEAEETSRTEETTEAEETSRAEETTEAEETSRAEESTGAEESAKAEETTAAEESSAAAESAADDAGAADEEQGPGVAAAEESAPEEVKQSRNGADIVELARSYVGKLPYVYGGTSLQTGADCSGFTQALFALFGISLPRGTGDQLSAGTRITKEQLQPGDLMFWQNSSGRIYHVGIYSGPDSFIHASNSARGWVFEDHIHDMPEACGYARY